MSNARTSLRTRTRALAAVLGALTLTFFVASASYAAVPTNDTIEQATVIPSVPFEDTVDTTDATEAEGDWGIATVWYKFIPSTDRAFIVGASLPDLCHFVGVFEGTPGSLMPIASNDSCMGYGDAVRVVLNAGTTYYIQAGTSWADGEPRGGLLTMSVEYAPPDVEATITIDPVSRLSKDGTATTVSGTLACNTEATVTLEGTVAQRQGLNLAHAGLYVTLPCGQVPSHWSDVATSWDRILLPKRASVHMSIYAYDGWTQSWTEATGPVTLTRRQ